jgi:F420-non-reducing hydrogenase small subunit
MMGKPRLATVVLGGCTGCHLSLLDAHERLIDLLGEVDLVHSPFTAGTEVPECDVALVEGAIGNDHDLEVLRQVRERAGTLIAMGSCATMGGIAGLRNLVGIDTVLDTAYGREAAKPGSNGSADRVPTMEQRVRPLSDAVEVDIVVPGCSPPTDTIIEALEAALAGERYELPRHNLCHECERTHEKMLEPTRDFVSESVYSVMELDRIDPGKCFLEQGVICMGPITRVGCGARCVGSNVPCRGCMGACRPDIEQGAKMVDVLGAVLPAGAIMYMDDLIGTAYRYTMPVSIFPVAAEKGSEDDG